MRIFLVSNMYPSKKSPFYGIFVKTFEEKMQANGITISSKAVIRGRSNNYLIKVFKYIKFFKDVYLGLLKSNYDVIYVRFCH